MTARHPARTANPGLTPPPGEETSPAAEAPAPARLAYSVDEAASLTGLSRDLRYDEMRRGHLGYLKVGRRRLITRQHLEQFLGIIPRQPSRTDVNERKAANGGP